MGGKKLIIIICLLGSLMIFVGGLFIVFHKENDYNDAKSIVCTKNILENNLEIEETYFFDYLNNKIDNEFKKILIKYFSENDYLNNKENISLYGRDRETMVTIEELEIIEQDLKNEYTNFYDQSYSAELGRVVHNYNDDSEIDFSSVLKQLEKDGYKCREGDYSESEK